MRLSRYDAGLVLVSLIWGANYSISKRALADISPAAFAAMRFALSTALLWGVVLWLDQRSQVPRATRWKLLGWGVVGHTLNQLAFLSGLKLTTATNSALIYGTLPVVVALLGIMLGHERPRPRVWLGIGLGTAGVTVVVAARGGARFGVDTVQGDVLNLIGLLCWALFTVGVRRAALGLSSAHVSALTHLGGTPGLILAAVPGTAAGGLTMTRSVWIALLYASLLGSVVASILWTRGLKVLGGSRTSLYNCLMPVVAAMFAWLLLGERLVPLQAAGAVLVVVGVLISRVPAEEVES